MRAIFGLLVAAIAVTAGTIEVRTALGETQTWDEGIHIWSGYAYLTRGDYSWNTEHPPLVKMICALPLLRLGLAAPSDPTLPPGDQVRYGIHFLYRNGRSPDLILFTARSANILLTLLFIVAVAWWTRRRWGSAAGLCAAAMCAFDPNLIAHGRYVTTDYPLTVFFFFACVLWVEYLEQGGLTRLFAAAGAFSIAMVVKFSAVLLVPSLLVLYIVCWIRRPAEFPIRRAVGVAAVMFAVLTVTVAVVYWPETIRCFRTKAPALDKVVNQDNFIGLTLAWLGEKFHLPAHDYLLGLARVAEHNTGGHPSYLMGMRSTTGFWYYFPVAFAVKSTLATLAAVLLIVVLGTWTVVQRGLRSITPMALGLALPPLLFFAFSMTSAINLGLRHILPVFPFIYVGLAALAAGPWRTLQRAASTLVSTAPRPPVLPEETSIRVSTRHAEARATWTLAAALLLVLVQAGECASIYPDYLAFFNAAAGGPGRGPEYLLDSNIDWGQDIKKLSRWLEQHGTHRAMVYYFGNAQMAHYGVEEVGFPKPLDAEGWDNIHDYIVASVTPLNGIYVPLNDLAPVRLHQPIAKIGWSMYVYDLRKPQAR